jgi:hypothetical protein
VTTRFEEVEMDEETTAPIYEHPVIYERLVLVELGEFGEDTLGSGYNYPDTVAVQR